jgi:hydroxymethylpyrimidine pyrophosphatase-like HAD family hydrolase
VPLPAGARRRAHRRALFRVRGVAADGAPRQFEVLAEATGVGYLGTHHVAVARALSAFAPRVLGFEDGVLYREWLPDHRRLPDSSDEFAAAVARYVATRRRTLRVARDVSAAMPGQRPVWEVVALILARGFAPAAPAMRAALVNRAVRRLLAVEHPSVVDGSMSRQHWFQGEEDGRVVKVSLSDRSYWRLGLTCFDASFDLAGAASGSSNGDLAAQVRDAWLTQTGEQVDPERWLLYELAHLWGLARRDPAREVEVRQASARAVARYFAGRFLADLDRPGTGPLCALDIDGVLEAGRLTFPTLTRASATALRALLTHGYRPVLATGRGIAEVRDRCRIYGLEGGVAEYGSAIYVARGDRSISLVDAESAAALSRLQAALRERAGASFDPGFRHALRAYNVRADGRPRPLDPGEAAACLDASDTATAVRAIPGENQTDFVPVAFDKGTGLRALIAALEASGGSESASALAMAVGDTAADAPMLALASAAFVPAHATHAAATTGARRVARPYQAGLHAAVGELLGHPPGSCRCCCVMPSTRESEVLVDLLSVSEDGARGFPLKTLRLMWKLR